MIVHIVLIEIAPSQNWNAPRLEIIRSNIVARGRGTLIHRQNLTVRARVKSCTASAGEQWDVAADCRALESWNRVQRSESLFHEMLARGWIGILRLRQRNQADPEIFGAEPNVLPAQLHKAGNE